MRACGWRTTVKVTREGRSVVIRLEAPHRKVWIDGLVHELVESCFSGNVEWVRAVKADVRERAAIGTTDCLDFPCDWCDGL